MRTCPRCKTAPSQEKHAYCKACQRAYDAARRPAKPKPTMEQRFWAKVRKEEFERDPGLGPCWMWTGSINPQSGYGMFQTGGRTSPGGHREPTQAHIVALRLVGKDVPDGCERDHFCRQRACVNPGHIDPVTHRENVSRGMSIVADYIHEQTCKRGHPKTPENRYQRPDGKGSQCLPCVRLRTRKGAA